MTTLPSKRKDVEDARVETVTLAEVAAVSQRVRAERGRNAKVALLAELFAKARGEAGVLDDSISGSAENDEFMLNPSAHLVWEVTNDDQLRFSVARTVRRPGIDQIPQHLPADGGVGIEKPRLDADVRAGGRNRGTSRHKLTRHDSRSLAREREDWI